MTQNATEYLGNSGLEFRDRDNEGVFVTKALYSHSRPVTKHQDTPINRNPGDDNAFKTKDEEYAESSSSSFSSSSSMME